MTTIQLQWLETYRSEITTIGSLSVGMLLLTVLATPWLISLLPVDYFRESKSQRRTGGLIAFIWAALRNLVGAFFMVAGIFMLVLPGPGLVSFIMGLSICEFPGKHRFLCNLIARYPGILKSLNWIRYKSGKERLLPPEE